MQRWLKFVKYLADFGWDAHILTVEEGTYPARDEALVKEIPSGVKVTKTKSKDPFRFYNMLKGKKDGSVSVALINIDKKRSLLDRLAMYIRSNFFIPDGRKGWVPYASREALKIIENENIDLLVTTGPPHSTHLAGLKIRKTKNIAWLADLRDPWTTVYYNDMLPRTASTRKKDKKLEDAVISGADAVTVVSPGMQQEFYGRNDQVHVVMNGFDADDMALSREDIEKDSLFSLTYTGNFKPNQHIPHIWDGICELLSENEEFRKDFRLRFVGNLDNSIPEYFKAKGFYENLELRSYVPHAEVTGIMASSALLLFVVPQSRNNKLIITGKLFEYLASGTPLIPVGPVDGDASAILKECGREPMMDYQGKDVFKETIMNKYMEWKKSGGALMKPDVGMLDRYSRRSSAKSMADIMNSLK